VPGFLTRIGARVKSVSRMVFGRSSQLFGPGWGWAHGFSRSDYTTYTGDGSHNSIVQAQFRWITDNFPEAELRVRRRGAKGQLDPVDNHPLVELLDTPNPFYSSLTLFDATYREWRRGNAYWIVLKNLAGKPVQLWWAPSAMMEPVQGDDPSVFISHYDYRPRADQGPIRLEIGDVVHFRNGLDPKYPQKGSSDLDCLLREIFTDDEAASWSSSLLANGAGPHVMISPDDEADIDEDEAAKIKTNYAQKTTGDHRGEPLVMAGKTKIQIMSFNPSEMDYKSLRRVPEERISAVIGVPAVVCGLGAGLDRSTYNNMREAKEMATENVLIPAWRFFAREIQRQLLPQFADPRRDVFDFDLSTVRALQDDQNALWTRIDDALGKGGITLNQSLEMRGLDTIGPAGDVYYLPINVTPTTAAMIGDGSAPDPVPAPVAPPVDESIPKSFADALWDTLETKDGANYVQAIQRLRARLQMPFERQMAKYLSGQQSRVIAALRENLKRGYAHEIKAGEEVLDWNEEQRLLQALFDAAYRRALDGTHNVAQDVLGTSFEIDDPLTRAYLQQAGQNIVGITETTQRAIAHTLQEGQALGEGVDELMARIQRLGAFSEGRARVIARTELGQATNMATLTSFEASGVVVGVRVHDGTDHEPCAGLNGKTFTLEAVAALPPLAHPNCVRAYAPLTRTSQLRTASHNGHVEHRELVAV
jgi:HK97 family phage portal protein